MAGVEPLRGHLVPLKTIQEVQVVEETGECSSLLGIEPELINPYDSGGTRPGATCQASKQGIEVVVRLVYST